MFLRVGDISLFIIRQNQKHTQHQGTRYQSEEEFLMFLSNNFCEMVKICVRFIIFVYFVYFDIFANSSIIHQPSYISSTSSGPIGTYGPSFISRITEPLSRARRVCHCPAGMFSATTGPFGVSSMASVHVLSSSS